MALSSYLNQMGGGGAAKPSSYGPSRGKPQAPPGGTGMGGFTPGGAPSFNGYASNGYQAPPAPNGHVAPKTSYAPTKSTFKYGGSGIGNYLDGFAGPPADPTDSMVAAEAPPAPTSANYLSQMGGAVANPSGPKTSYAPTKSNFKSGGSGIGNYLDGFAGPPAVVLEDSMVGGTDLTGNGAPGAFGYLASMGGGGSAMKPSSYGPGKGGKPQAPAGGTGMGGFVPGGGAAPSAQMANASPTSGNFPSQMGAGAAAAASGPKTSYAPTKSTFKYGGSGIGNYLDGFAGPPSDPTNSMVAAEAPPAPTSANYLSQMGGAVANSSGPKTSYAPTKSNFKSGGSGIGNYLDGFAGPPAVVLEDSMVGGTDLTGNVAPNSFGYLASMGGGGSAMKPSSYGPSKGGKPQAPAGGTGMGGFVPGGGAVPSSNGYEAPAAQSSPAAPTAAGYLSQMGGGGGTMKLSGYGPKKNW
jgi:hypothetical protein